jgi:hypothetical protein
MGAERKESSKALSLQQHYFIMSSSRQDQSPPGSPGQQYRLVIDPYLANSSSSHGQAVVGVPGRAPLPHSNIANSSCSHDDALSPRSPKSPHDPNHVSPVTAIRRKFEQRLSVLAMAPNPQLQGRTPQPHAGDNTVPPTQQARARSSPPAPPPSQADTESMASHVTCFIVSICYTSFV